MYFHTTNNHEEAYWKQPFTERRRDYLINRIMKTVCALEDASDKSGLGWFEDGIGLTWYWHVGKLTRLSDTTLKELFMRRDRPHGIPVGDIDIVEK